MASLTVSVCHWKHGENLTVICNLLWALNILLPYISYCCWILNYEWTCCLYELGFVSSMYKWLCDGIILRTLIADTADSLVQCADFRNCLPNQDAPMSSGPLAAMQGRNFKYDTDILVSLNTRFIHCKEKFECEIWLWCLQCRSPGLTPLLHTSPPSAEHDAGLPGESVSICSHSSVSTGISLLAAHLRAFSRQWRWWSLTHNMMLFTSSFLCLTFYLLFARFRLSSQRTL